MSSNLRSMALAAIAAVFQLGGCGGTPALAPSTGPLAPPEEPAPAKLAMERAEQRRVLGLLGTEVTVPAGFHFAVRPQNAIVLDTPERDATVLLALVEGEDATRALDEVWARGELQKPDGKPEEYRAPPNEEWDEIVQLDYPGGEHVALGNVRRKGRTNFVTLMAGSPAAMKKRARELGMIAREWGPVDRHWSVRTPLSWSKQMASDLDGFAQKAMTELHVPGLAYAVVEDGKVVHERVLGVKQLGKPAKIRRETAFLLGSLSGSLSSLLVASLVDAGTVSWDTKLTQLLPAFQLRDAAASESVTLTSAFCACTAISRRDLPLVFEYEAKTAESALESLHDLAPTAATGETFQQSSQLLGSGGFAAAHAAYPDVALGPAYERAMATHVFAPMGMKHATASFPKAIAGDHASPHAPTLDAKSGVVAMPVKVERFVLPWAPAGAVWASIADLEQYLLTELAEGKAPDGKRVASREQTLRRRARGVQMGPRAFYGLGLAVSERFGRLEIDHAGGTFGMAAQLVFHPETGRGVVVLANSAEPLLTALIARRALELPYGDAHAEPALARSLNAQRASTEKTTARFLPADAALASALTGTYRNAQLGTLRLTPAAAPDLVWVDAGEWKSRARLAKTEAGTENELLLLDPPAAGLSFGLRGEGAARTLSIELGTEHEVFARAP